MVAFQDLTPTAQTVAEREFMAFYIRHFKRDDLEVLTELASDSQQAMINRVLRTNGFMTVEQLVTVSLPLTKDLFAALLANKSFVNGKLTVTNCSTVIKPFVRNTRLIIAC